MFLTIIERQIIFQEFIFFEKKYIYIFLANTDQKREKYLTKVICF